MSLEFTKKRDWSDKAGMLSIFLIMSSWFVKYIWPHGTWMYTAVSSVIYSLMILCFATLLLPRLIEIRHQNITRVVLLLFGVGSILFIIGMSTDNIPLLTIGGGLLLIVLLADNQRVRAFFARLGRSSGDGVQRS
jgi:hypothetical protein